MLSNEDSEIIKSKIKSHLDKALSHINNILKHCESFKKFQNEINKIIYEHPIYKNRNKIKSFSELVVNAGTLLREKIIEVQEQSEIRIKRKNEIKKINNFLQNDYHQLILDDTKNNTKLLPSQPEIELNKDISKKDDDILVEDTKKEDKNIFLNKKTKSDNKNIEINKIDEILNKCYICRENLYINNIHKFYSNLCTKCGDFNYSFRILKINLEGRIAIVTGGRIKIGYYIATKLLSYGCKVLITSRFPKDTLFKYQENSEYENWKNNLIIYPIDFRIFESVIKFIKFINENFPHIDILINNAAQTIRKTSSYYKYLLPIESKKLSPEDEKKIIKIDYINLENKLKEEKNKKNEENSLISLINKNENEYKEILPLSFIASQIKIMEEKKQPIINILGNDGQPYDFSQGKGSWNYEFDEIPFQEFTEVQIINAWIPYYLCVKLKPLMIKSPYPDKYIINVTSVEGNFNNISKRTAHVHTNMAKAAINMFTRTCAKYLKKDGIYMNCVDTGWVSSLRQMNNFLDKKEKENYEGVYKNIPLDELDGAMRVLHPIIEGIKNKNYLWGNLLKNYQKSDWI